MYKVEVGKGPLMFMSYARIMKEVIVDIKLEEDKEAFYAILYDFGIPIGCGRLIMDKKTFNIDNINIFENHNTENLKADIKTQLLKKANSLGFKVMK